MTSQESYGAKIVSDILFNESSHVVAVFKDFLIYDDINEFLKKCYNKSESIEKLKKVCFFYDKYSKVFANYSELPESKYMFKNIEKKQKLLDELQKESERLSAEIDVGNNIIFGKEFMDGLVDDDKKLSEKSILNSYIKYAEE